MSIEKVFIITESPLFYESEMKDKNNLANILPFITYENEYSFGGYGMLSHGHCLEAQVGQRPHDIYMEIRKLRPLLKIPFVKFLDLSNSGENIIDEIKMTRRWHPLSVFILFCSSDEYIRCLSEVPEDWKLRFSRFFRFLKEEQGISKSQLRVLLDAATKTAIEKVNQAHVYTAFISYSHTDQLFAKWLYQMLENCGIRCWLDEKQIHAGDRIHVEVEKAILRQDKVLLCASKASLTSWWVDNEINSVIAKEQVLWKQMGEEALVLIPINLDGYMFTQEWKSGWKNQVVSRLAPDFTNWASDKPFECSDALSSLIHALIIDNTITDNPFTKI